MQNAIDAALAAYGTKTATTGGGVSALGLITQSWFIGFVGLLIAALGFFMSWFYQHRRDRREQEEHDARMRSM